MEDKRAWLNRSQKNIQDACTPFGIRASVNDVDNYAAIFTRDAVMSGIAGLLLDDRIIIDGFVQTIKNLKKIQGNQGQIVSNFTVSANEISKVSFGTLSPKIDGCTWYLIGVALLIKSGEIAKSDYLESAEKVIDLLEGIEYNGKNLVYIPKGGNWADEYVFEGYILYDQVLRVWALNLLGKLYDQPAWQTKSESILKAIKTEYTTTELPYLVASIFPGGRFDKFDLAAHALLGIADSDDSSQIETVLDHIDQLFLENDQLPPAFYPVISPPAADWQALSAFHLFGFKNKPHHYHNGGIWFIWLGWLAVALELNGKTDIRNKLVNKAFQYLESQPNFDFDEYIVADSGRPAGTKKLCYTATGIIFLILASQNHDFNHLRP